MKRLFFDIETSPNVVLSWRIGYNLNIPYENIIEERAIICIAWKWEGESKVYSATWDKNHNDKKLLQQFLSVANEADELVAYFGDSFDVPWVRTRCIFHGLLFPEWKTIDPKSWASRKFYFNCNKLDYISQFLGMEAKIDTDFELWKRVLADDPKALKYMVKYNEKDVTILENVFSKMSKLVKPKSHKGVMDDNGKWSCPRCGGVNVSTSKRRVSAAGTIQWQMQCKDDGGYYAISDKAHEIYKLDKKVSSSPV